MFGLTADKLRGRAFVHRCQLEINEGDIVYITGPSGAGKSVLLGELEKQIPEGDRINLSQIELSADRAVIDCIDGGFVESLAALNTAGLNDVYCVLGRPALLSDGQKMRYRLATALGSGKKFVLADEFCSQLDRITAAVIAYNVRRFASRYGVTFLLASCHDDILTDLQPDVIVAKDLSGETEVVYKDSRRSRS
jgi:ABC-type ATPase with predicted acetyltransferase domain